MLIDDLHAHREYIPEIARWHFDQWGPLTGARTFEDYLFSLEEVASGSGVPSVLVAFRESTLLGSVSLVVCDMIIRPSLTPWLAQLFVLPSYRHQAVGAALVRAAAARAQKLGFPRLYLYTSGDVPPYYERLAWIIDEQVEYLGKVRTVMHYDLVT